jgi:hypothetical protein
MKAILSLSTAALLLSACANAPSPQDTSPTKEAKCKSLQMQMMPTGSQNNTPNAVLASEQDSLRQTYKTECE